MRPVQWRTSCLWFVRFCLRFCPSPSSNPRVKGNRNRLLHYIFFFLFINKIIRILMLFPWIQRLSLFKVESDVTLVSLSSVVSLGLCLCKIVSVFPGIHAPTLQGRFPRRSRARPPRALPPFNAWSCSSLIACTFFARIYMYISTWLLSFHLTLFIILNNGHYHSSTLSSLSSSSSAYLHPMIFIDIYLSRL